jgi:hypothetical protein
MLDWRRLATGRGLRFIAEAKQIWPNMDGEEVVGKLDLALQETRAQLDGIPRDDWDQFSLTPACDRRRPWTGYLWMRIGDRAPLRKMCALTLLHQFAAHDSHREQICLGPSFV